MKKAFITGATGNIGAPLVQYLLDLEIPFTAGSRHVSSSDFPTRQIDFNDVSNLKAAFSEHEVLFLLTPDSVDAQRWVGNALEAAAETGIKHIVRSSGIDANPRSDYLVFKELGQMEVLVKDSGLNYTFVQPNSFFQNFATFQNQSIKNGTVYLPHANTSVSYVDARDVAFAIACILKDPAKHIGQSYVITGPAAVTDQELLDTIGEMLDKTIKYVAVSDEDTAATFRRFHMPEHNIAQLISLYQADRAGRTAIVSSDFKHITGQEPRDARTFAREHKDYWA